MTPEQSAQKIVVERHDVIYSIDDAKKLGLEDREIERLCYRVSRAVDDNNKIFPGVMLPKSSEEIYEKLKDGSACMIISEGHKQWEFLHFNARYNLYLGNNELASVSELGTLITDIKYRGHGLATTGAEYQMSGVKKDDKDAVFLATIKGSTAAHTLIRAGFEIISFQKYPDLTSLTCTCTTSEQENNNITCKYRRNFLESAPEIISDISKKIMNKSIKTSLPCTLLAAGAYDKFQERCKKIHENNNRFQEEIISKKTFVISNNIFNNNEK